MTFLKNAKNFTTKDLNYLNVSFHFSFFPISIFRYSLKYTLTHISFFISNLEMEFLKLKCINRISCKIGRLITFTGHNIPDIVIRSPAYTAIGSLFKYTSSISRVIIISLWLKFIDIYRLILEFIVPLRFLQNFHLHFENC